MTTITSTFDMIIPPNYFPSHRIIKPFSMRVCYEGTIETRSVDNIRVTFEAHLFAIMGGNMGNLMLDVEEAAINNFNSMCEGENEESDGLETIGCIAKELIH